ncbi:helix-turn-helix transcriptional regulator [Effusibacillus dendaii]|uniref:Uncharacterized protein n=1 Tax=Effusibacillus dendaii TaxID=2743772 RepID=A0A7I8DDT2_9BACL|nr:helix-turn-helix transcriptional regulator [Effusibacillus dendaii]BCJ87119.1 hypothetical protein skT53_21040 [Effusibacillus dendaii]
MSSNPFLTAEEAADLLKISKYTLYELVKRAELPAQRVGRQLRFHRDELNQILRGSVVATGTADSQQESSEINLLPDDRNTSIRQYAADLRFVGSHDPVVEMLAEFLKYASPSVVLDCAFTGSMEGLHSLYQGEAELTGIHLWDEKTGEYNLSFIEYLLPGESVTVVNLAQRVQGWIVPPGNPLQMRTMQDIAKPGVRFINRQKGSGTRLRIDSFLRKSGIPSASITGYEFEETTHFGVAYRIANGEANAGIGVQTSASRLGLDFVPLYHERYDLVCLEKTVQTTHWKQLLAVLRSPAFQNAIRSQAGYDPTLTGTYIQRGEKV